MKRVLMIGLLFAASAAAQIVDPDPSEPGAQEFAERQYIMSLVGLMPAPIGWVCRFGSTPDDSWWTAACYPDPAVIDEQEEARERFRREFRARSRRR